MVHFSSRTGSYLSGSVGRVLVDVTDIVMLCKLSSGHAGTIAIFELPGWDNPHIDGGLSLCSMIFCLELLRTSDRRRVQSTLGHNDETK
ncbi:hypothetical protein POX_a01463 [Penicillium oxalicum]|uniref:hypothetical protein n=1 Tax=Penicillium oxalicum TaxID=69781 RepID=UPI0020B7FB12|nr:hypothetical protein POX_a01463 [Penicillium oxalicum]KAI2794862.1 hypothetical protein POX_a01463 [Penicillium oxalicum]